MRLKIQTNRGFSSEILMRRSKIRTLPVYAALRRGAARR
jgi:hypothetical protein